MLRYSSCFSFACIFVALSALPVLGASYYTQGHADLGLGEGDELELHVHCHAGAVIDGEAIGEDQEFDDPSEVYIVVPVSTKNYIHSIGGATTIVANKLGLSAGDDYWYLPEIGSGNPGSAELQSPNFGLGSEDINPGIFDSNGLTLSLTGMSGPDGGNFGLENYEHGWLMCSNDGITVADTIYGLPTGSLHEHLNWYFTKSGLYELTFKVSATTVGGVYQEDTKTFYFQVVPEPHCILLLASAISACVAMSIIRRYRA
jgi:surface-anchored protein